MQHPAASSEAQAEKSNKMMSEMRSALHQRGRDFMDVYLQAGLATSADMGYDPAKHFRECGPDPGYLNRRGATAAVPLPPCLSSQPCLGFSSRPQANLTLTDKRNTLMLPAYQRRGLGTWLTEYCNSFADEAGKPTFVLARPKAWGMLERTGFELQYTVVPPTKQFGWHEDATVKAFKRDPREPIHGAGTNAA